MPSSDGVLPPWSRWWGDHAIERLIGDAEAFRRFEGGLPRLPVSWFDDRIDVPPWDHLPAGYLQTSERLAASANDARSRGWPVRVLSGTHLHAFTDPQETVDALLDIAASLRSRA